MRSQSLFVSTVLFVGAAGMFVRQASAGPVFTPPQFDTELSDISMTHAADTQNPSLTGFTVDVNPPPAALPSSFQLSHTFHNTGPGGASSTAAFGAVSEFTSAVNTSLDFKAGTGVTQTNVPGEAYTGPSALLIGINADWTLPSGFPSAGFQPVLFYDFPVGGTVGIGGRDRFTATLSIVEVNGNASTFLGSIALDKTYTNPSTTTPLPFTDSTLTGTIVLNKGLALPAGAELLITGNVEFRAKNAESPSTTELAQNGVFGSIAQPISTVPLPTSWVLGSVGLVGLALSQRVLRRKLSV